MRLTHTPLVIANWKMNPQSAKAAAKLFGDIQKGVARVRGVDIGIAPPMPYLLDLQKLAKGKRVVLVAQDVFWENIGARTGEVSAPMLKSVGASGVIIGHSERRALGESDEQVNKKVLATLKTNLRVILCVGEKERDTDGSYLSFVEQQ